MLSSLASVFRRNSDVEKAADGITSKANVLKDVVESMDCSQNMDVDKNDDFTRNLNLVSDPDVNSESSPKHGSSICDTDQECEETHPILHLESTSTSSRSSQEIVNSVDVQCDDMDIDKNDDFNRLLNLFPDPDVNSESSPKHGSSMCDTDQECEETLPISMHLESTSTSARSSQEIMNSVAVQCDLLHVVSTGVQCEPVLQVTQSVQCDSVLVKSQSVQCELQSLVTQGVQCKRILQISQAVQYEAPCILSHKEQNLLSEDCVNIVSSSQTSTLMSTSESTVQVSEENREACKIKCKSSQDCDSTKSLSGDGETSFLASDHEGDTRKKTKKMKRKRRCCITSEKGKGIASPLKSIEKCRGDYFNLSRDPSQDTLEKNNGIELSYKNMVEETEKGNKDDNERRLSTECEKNEETSSFSKPKEKRDEDYSAEELINEMSEKLANKMNNSNEFSLKNQDHINTDSGDCPRNKNKETKKCNELSEKKMLESTCSLDDTSRNCELNEPSESEPSQLNTTQWFNSLACERASSPESINEDAIEELSKSRSKYPFHLQLEDIKKKTKCLDDDTNYRNEAAPSWLQRKCLKKARGQRLQEETEETDKEPCGRRSSKLNESSENEPNHVNTTQFFNSLACERASSPENINEETVDELRETRSYCYRKLYSKGIDDNNKYKKRSGPSRQQGSPLKKSRDQYLQEEPRETDQEPCGRRSSKFNKSSKDDQMQFNTPQWANSLACERASSPEILSEDIVEEPKESQSYCYRQLHSKVTKNIKDLDDNVNHQNRAGPSLSQRSPWKISRVQHLQEDPKEIDLEPNEKRKHYKSKSTPQKERLVAYSDSECDSDSSSRSVLHSSSKEKCDNVQKMCTVTEEQSARIQVCKSDTQGGRNTKVRRTPRDTPKIERTRPIRDLRFFDDSDSDCASTVTYMTTTSTRSRRSYHQKRFYTKEEREAILFYIINKRCFKLVKGRAFWERMERANICPGRTWQSLKEHFRKYILPNIEDYNLDSSVVKKFISVRK